MFEGLADKAAENTDTNSDASQAPDVSTEQVEAKSDETTEQSAKAVLDLAKAEKFLFEGKEMTYEDLKKSYLRQQDYTKKTQELAQERKFMDNLSWDLKKVKTNPALASEFKKIYPEKFHSYLDVIIEQQAREDKGQGAASQLPQEFLDKLSQHEEMLQSFQSERQQAEQAKISNTLEQFEQKFTKKYPQAELGSVYHAMETHVRQMRDENPDYGFKDMNEKVIEGFYKSTHDYFAKRFSDWQKSQLKSIKDANSMGSDIPPGGGIPGEAPQKMRLKDVAEHAVRSLDN